MIISLIAMVALVALDQISKYFATLYLAPVGVMPFIPGVMELRYVLNDGAAFSMFSGGNAWILITVTSVALTAMCVWFFWKKPSCALVRAAFILVIAGGVGNLIDRVLNGHVVDFFATTFMNFAVFNVADCFVCVGVVLLLIAVLRDEAKNKKQAQPSSDAQP